MLNLLPRPKKIKTIEKTVQLSSFTFAKVSGIATEHLSALKLFNPDLKIELDADGFYFALYTEACPEALPMEEGIDAYSLSVSETGVRADAETAEGLFYALQTFLQLPENCNCGEIFDAASIRYRMIHWDLKGFLPHLETLKAHMRRLAAYKINVVLLELEDKYDYRCAPDVGVEGAYTFEEMREFSKFAKSLHITIIPKLQSIAHVDYILKHDRYKHLRENDHVFQYCPSNPEVHTLWTAMCDELLECFAEHGPYFHIGADEPIYLGECPECAKIGKASCYLQKVNACVEYVVSKNRIPVMWDDIIRNAEGLFSPEEADHLRKTLGKQAIIMYWSYGFGGKRNEFPFTKEYLDAGLKVWGSSGYGGCDNWAGCVAPLSMRGLNIDAWNKEAATYGLEGVCATGWARIGSADCPSEPKEGCWFTVLYAASTMWNPEACAYDAFVDMLAPKLYGVPVDEALKAAILRVGQNPYPYQNFVSSPEDEPEELKTLKILAATESLSVQQNKLVAKFQYYDLKFGKKMEDYRYDQIMDFAKELLEELSAVRQALQSHLSNYYKEVTVAEVVATRINYLEKLTHQLLALMESTQKY